MEKAAKLAAMGRAVLPPIGWQKEEPRDHHTHNPTNRSPRKIWRNFLKFMIENRSVTNGCK
ncbi:MAG: hypothetical protein ACI9EH_000181 [Planktomarina sp.]|jgi:hypothetical protein|tara:strand:- start:329 stop:511 length:183 start_codon:yes stop_codon:yes gene_type:complete